MTTLTSAMSYSRYSSWQDTTSPFTRSLPPASLPPSWTTHLLSCYPSIPLLLMDACVNPSHSPPSKRSSDARTLQTKFQARKSYDRLSLITQFFREPHLLHHGPGERRGNRAPDR